ncbi:MAG: hypothetical protein IPH89_01885 [Bacteroidetes bacterium]|nr:hypothetical protein [Bacteroidota bacterium]
MKKQATIRNLFVLFFFIASFGLSAQEQNNQTYHIINNGTVQNVQSYIDALNASNLKYHRLITTILFETGLKVELYSATELVAAGRSINLADYPVSFPATRVEPTFVLGANNFIIEMHSVEGKHH